MCLLFRAAPKELVLSSTGACRPPATTGSTNSNVFLADEQRTEKKRCTLLKYVLTVGMYSGGTLEPTSSMTLMVPGYLPEYLPEYELGTRVPTRVLPQYEFGYPSTYPSIILVVPECLPEYELVPEYITEYLPKYIHEYLPEYDSGGTRVPSPSMTKIANFGTSGTPGYILY